MANERNRADDRTYLERTRADEFAVYRSSDVADPRERESAQNIKDSIVLGGAGVPAPARFAYQRDPFDPPDVLLSSNPTVRIHVPSHDSVTKPLIYPMPIEREPQLGSPPTYFCKYSAFYCACVAATILAHIKAMLEDMMIDYEVNKTLSKISGLVRELSRAQFTIQFYQAGEEVLAVFNRTEGCTITFNHMYKTILNRLSTTSLKIRRAVNKPLSEEQLSDLPHPEPAAPEPVSVELLNNFLNLVRDAKIDVQREALAVLLALTRTPEATQAYLSLPSALSVIPEALSIEDDIVRENACALVVNLCLHGENQETLKALVPSLNKLLIAPSASLSSKFCRRQAEFAKQTLLRDTRLK